MLRKNVIQVPIFDCEIRVMIGDGKAILKSINYYTRIVSPEGDLLGSAPSGYCMVGRPDGKVGLYCLFLDKDDLSTDIINHEKSHVIDFILKDRDIRLHDEVRAYFDGWLSHKLELVIKKKQKLRVKNKR